MRYPEVSNELRLKNFSRWAIRACLNFVFEGEKAGLWRVGTRAKARELKSMGQGA